MEEIKLVEPNNKYKNSFIEALKEYKEVDGDDINIEEKERDFDDFVLKLEKDKTIDDGTRVPSFAYWCVIGDKYIGRINYRPKLNDYLRFKGGNIGYSIRPSERGKGYATFLLREIIKRAKADGLEELLITCDSSNEASKNVIKKNEGVYKDGGLDENNVEIDRYIIKLN